MSINRRDFMVGVASATLAAGAASVLRKRGGADERAIMQVIQERFPYVAADDPALLAFACAFAARGEHIPGSSHFTKAEAIDRNNPAIDFERYVAREFATSTNALDYGAGQHARLEYAPAPALDHSPQRFVRSPAVEC